MTSQTTNTGVVGRLGLEEAMADWKVWDALNALEAERLEMLGNLHRALDALEGVLKWDQEQCDHKGAEPCQCPTCDEARAVLADLRPEEKS